MSGDSVYEQRPIITCERAFITCERGFICERAFTCESDPRIDRRAKGDPMYCMLSTDPSTFTHPRV